MGQGGAEIESGDLPAPLPSLKFILPRVPPSMNSIYNVLFGLRKIELKPECRLYKTNMKMYVPSLNVKKEDKVYIKISVYMNTLFKNGNLRKIDVHNLTKILIDLISEKQGWDDSQLWELNLSKKHDANNERVEVEIWKQ